MVGYWTYIQSCKCLDDLHQTRGQDHVKPTDCIPTANGTFAVAFGGVDRNFCFAIAPKYLVGFLHTGPRCTTQAIDQTITVADLFIFKLLTMSLQAVAIVHKEPLYFLLWIRPNKTLAAKFEL